MTLLSRMIGGAAELRGASPLSNPSPELADALRGDVRASSGRAVNVNGALGLVPVYSAVSLIAGTIGSLPLIFYRRTDAGRDRTSTRTSRLLTDQPNPDMSADELWETVTGHLLLWGNAYLAKLRDEHQTVTELRPLRPDRVRVKTDEHGRYYLLDGDQTRYRGSDVLHVRGLGTDGLVGLSPVAQARQMLGGAMEMDEFTGRLWRDGAYPGGVLSHPGRLSRHAKRELRRDWRALHAGRRSGVSVAVLDEGVTWQQTGLPMKDAQFIETQQFSDLRIAQLFRIPPRFLGAKSGDSLTYTTTELEGIDFATYTLRRWLVRIEQSILRDPDLVPPRARARVYPEFLVDALMRASTKERFEAYTLALNPAQGWMSRAEVRERENLPPEA